MALYPYVATLAVDPVTLVKAAGATGVIYAPEDTGFASPLTASDASGNPTPLTANPDGILPSFYSTSPAVNWRSGSYVFPLVTSMPLPGPQGTPGSNGEPGAPGLNGSNVIPTAQAIAETPIPTEPLNLKKQFGAVGDGIADDTAALQALLDAAVTSRRAAYIPRGRYKITAALTVTITDATKWIGGVRIFGDQMGFAREGDYPGSVIEPTNAVTTAAIVISGAPNTDNSNRGQINGLVIEDIGIRGVSNGTNGDGIRLSYYTNATIRRVMVTNCADALKIYRQANGTTFGYANQLIVESFFAVANRGWGINAGTIGALCGVNIFASNFGSNTLGGVKIVPGPATITGNIYTGNGGPALLVIKPVGESNAVGPTVIGDHYEYNSTPAIADYSAGSAQVVLEYAQSPRFIGCNWLGSTLGENDIMAGHVDKVTGLTIVGGSHFGRQSIAAQTVIVVGPLLERVRFTDTEATGYAGSSARATSAQMFKSTETDTWTYKHLAADNTINGGIAASTGVATVLIENAMLPIGCVGYFEISSQGGAVNTYGIVRRSRDGGSLTVTQLAASADCSISVASNSLRVTQTNTASLQMFWSMQIVRTV
jgi:hypothetical protein